MVTNRQVIAMLFELARLTTLEEGSPQAFKVRAYEAAADALEGVGREVAGLSEQELVSIKGVGPSIAKKIAELTATGRVQKLDELRQKYPPAFVELTRIPGLGPKTLQLIRARLGVENLEQLKAALAAQQLRHLPGIGAVSEEKIGRAIERLGLHGKDRRTPIVDALPLAEVLVERLRELPDVEAAHYCGSLRRFSETIGDLDIVVATNNPVAVMGAVTKLAIAAEVVVSGEAKTSILTREGLQVDIRAVRPDQLGAALVYFTGSKTHNIALRQIAIGRGWLLNEYGLLEGETVVASRTEEDIYQALGLDPVPPELRESTGEVEAAARHQLPDLVDLADIKGDLHYHTDLSGDGRAGLEEMVEAASLRGLRYLAITDHGQDLAINGVDKEQMLAHQHRITGLQESYPKMRLLFGCELNIGPDGSLDYDPDFRLRFDWCVASVHSHFDLSQPQQTERILKAMEDPAVNAIGHLSGRMIGRRPGIDLDIDAVLEAALATGTALEVNGALDRLDASSEVIRRAMARGVTLVISTDSHHPSDAVRMAFGVCNARRGWAETALVANTWPQKTFLAWAARRRPAPTFLREP